MESLCLGLLDGYHCVANSSQSIHCVNGTIAANYQALTRAATAVTCACDPWTGYCVAVPRLNSLEGLSAFFLLVLVAIGLGVVLSAAIRYVRRRAERGKGYALTDPCASTEPR